MMCGPGGAGKTTWAKRLEGKVWTRLSFEVATWVSGQLEVVRADPREPHSF